MFGPIGIQELIVIFLVALLIFGPRKLPELGKSIGRGLAEFKRASEDLKRTIEEEIEVGKKEASSLRSQMGEIRNTLTSPDRLPKEEKPEISEVDSRPIQPS